MLQESNGTVMTLIDASIDPQRFLELGAGDLKRSASASREPFTLRENRIHLNVREDQHRRVTGVINRVTQNDLVVTWTETWLYERKEFSSRHRLVYIRVPPASIQR